MLIILSIYDLFCNFYFFLFFSANLHSSNFINERNFFSFRQNFLALFFCWFTLKIKVSLLPFLLYIKGHLIMYAQSGTPTSHLAQWLHYGITFIFSFLRTLRFLLHLIKFFFYSFLADVFNLTVLKNFEIFRNVQRWSCPRNICSLFAIYWSEYWDYLREIIYTREYFYFPFRRLSDLSRHVLLTSSSS